MNELDEFRWDAYELSHIYIEQTKALHDKHLMNKEFEPGQLVLLYNMRLRLHPEKLKSRWTSPYEVVEVHLHGVVMIKNQRGETFKVNGHYLKIYYGGGFDREQQSIDLVEITYLWVMSSS